MPHGEPLPTDLPRFDQVRRYRALDEAIGKDAGAWMSVLGFDQLALDLRGVVDAKVVVYATNEETGSPESEPGHAVDYFDRSGHYILTPPAARLRVAVDQCAQTTPISAVLLVAHTRKV